MSKAATERLIAVLRDQAMPQGGWTARALGQAAGMKSEELHAAVRSLRYSGRMAFDSYALSPSMLAERESPRSCAVEPERTVPSPSSIAQLVAEEARTAVERRRMARSLGQVVKVLDAPASVGSQMQDMALRDDPLMAATILRERWAEIWPAIRASAARQGERPVQAMVRLIETALEREARQ